MATPVEYLGPIETKAPEYLGPLEQTPAQAQAAAMGYPGLVPGTPGGYKSIKEWAGSPAGKFVLPATGALLGSILGPGGFWAGLGLGAAGAATGEAGREVLAGEQISPGKIGVEGLLSAIPGIGTKYIGGPVLRGATRMFPGTAAALQQGAVRALQVAGRRIKAPSPKESYQLLETQMLQVGPESIPVPKLTQNIGRWTQELTTHIPDWKLLPAANPLRQSAEALEKLGASRGGQLPINLIQEVMESIGPRAQRAAGKAGGALKQIYGSLKEGLEGAVKGGSQQAELLLEGQELAKRQAAIIGTKTKPGLRREIQAATPVVEGTPGYRQAKTAPLFELLPEQGRLPATELQEKLKAVLKDKEINILREAFKKASTVPKIRTGAPGLAERLALYLPMSTMGYAFGGAPGIAISGVGAEQFRRFLLTPAGMKFAQRMAAAQPGQGVGTKALQSLLPGLAGAVD